MPITQKRRRAAYKGSERRQSRLFAWPLALAMACVAGIVYATLCPIGMRPHLASADEERFGAYFVLGVFLALAAPRRWASITIFVTVLAIGLEAGQLLVPGRDGRVHDAAIKAIGGVLGAQAGFASFALRRLIQRHMPAPTHSSVVRA